MENRSIQLVSHWPHRLAVALACATFPLVWVGGLVTTHDAGMAVPDWPDTYGYNLFQYPLSEWLLGPWDLFIEHGHRLFAAAVGLLCIVLVVVVWRTDGRRWMRYAALTALALVICQGVLGGMRVVLEARTLAMIHGCVGPLFFTFTVLLATVTSRRWQDADDVDSAAADSGIAASAITVTGLAFMQLLLGAQLRHQVETMPPATFRVFVVLHLIVAGILTVAILFLALRARSVRHAHRAWLLRPAAALVALVALQLALGAGAWVTNYGWPAWFQNYIWAADFVVRAKGQWQSSITTAHVAAGSLILAISAMTALRALRLARPGQLSTVHSFVRGGAPA